VILKAKASKAKLKQSEWKPRLLYPSPSVDASS